VQSARLAARWPAPQGLAERLHRRTWGEGDPDKPLVFLDDVKGCSSIGALLVAFACITLALQVSFPEHAVSTGRWFLALQRHIRRERKLGASWPVLSKWYLALMKRVDRRVERVALHEVPQVEELNLDHINDPNAHYTTTYLSARAPEIAARAQAMATKANSSSDGGSALAGTPSEKQLTRLLNALKKRNLDDKGGKGKGAKRKRARGARGGKGDDDGESEDDAPPATPKIKGKLLLTDKSNTSGKVCADKSIYLNADGRFTKSVQDTTKELTAEMGNWSKKDPCCFFHVKNNCTKGSDCNYYH